MPAIEAYKLTKRFGDLVAVNEIDLRVKEGEIFGFLGPNGAGKTTTIHMLTTLLRPTSGKAYVGGYDVTREAWKVRRIIGIVFQDPSLDIQLTAWENLDFHGRIYHMSKAEREKRIVEVLSMVDLEDRAHEVVRNFSSGMRRRLEIARSFMHHAKILFLDEPTLGLDPQTRRHIWEYIRRINRELGVTIMLTTHYMEEADQLSDRVAIIDHGRIVAEGTPKELKDSIGGDVVRVESDKPKLLLKGLRVTAGSMIYNSKVVGRDVVLSVKRAEEVLPLIFETSQKFAVTVSKVTYKEPSLEDVFLHYTGREYREEQPERFEMLKMRIRRRLR